MSTVSTYGPDEPCETSHARRPYGFLSTTTTMAIALMFSIAALAVSGWLAADKIKDVFSKTPVTFSISRMPVPPGIAATWATWHAYHAEGCNCQPDDVAPAFIEKQAHESMFTSFSDDDRAVIKSTIDTWMIHHPWFTRPENVLWADFGCCDTSPDFQWGEVLAYDADWVVSYEPSVSRGFAARIAVSSRRHCIMPPRAPFNVPLTVAPRNVMTWPDHWHAWVVHFKTGQFERQRTNARTEVAYLAKGLQSGRAKVTYPYPKLPTTYHGVVQVWVFPPTNEELAAQVAEITDAYGASIKSLNEQSYQYADLVKALQGLWTRVHSRAVAAVEGLKTAVVQSMEDLTNSIVDELLSSQRKAEQMIGERVTGIFKEIQETSTDQAIALDKRYQEISKMVDDWLANVQRAKATLEGQLARADSPLKNLDAAEAKARKFSADLEKRYRAISGQLDSMEAKGNKVQEVLDAKEAHTTALLSELNTTLDGMMQAAFLELQTLVAEYKAATAGLTDGAPLIPDVNKLYTREEVDILVTGLTTDYTRKFEDFTSSHRKEMDNRTHEATTLMKAALDKATKDILADATRASEKALSDQKAALRKEAKAAIEKSARDITDALKGELSKALAGAKSATTTTITTNVPHACEVTRLEFDQTWKNFHDVCRDRACRCSKTKPAELKPIGLELTDDETEQILDKLVSALSQTDIGDRILNALDLKVSRILQQPSDELITTLWHTPAFYQKMSSEIKEAARLNRIGLIEEVEKSPHWHNSLQERTVAVSRHIEENVVKSVTKLFQTEQAAIDRFQQDQLEWRESISRSYARYNERLELLEAQHPVDGEGLTAREVDIRQRSLAAASGMFTSWLESAELLTTVRRITASTLANFAEHPEAGRELLALMDDRMKLIFAAHPCQHKCEVPRQEFLEAISVREKACATISNQYFHAAWIDSQVRPVVEAALTKHKEERLDDTSPAPQPVTLSEDPLTPTNLWRILTIDSEFSKRVYRALREPLPGSDSVDRLILYALRDWNGGTATRTFYAIPAPFTAAMVTQAVRAVHFTSAAKLALNADNQTTNRRQETAVINGSTIVMYNTHQNTYSGNFNSPDLSSNYARWLDTTRANGRPLRSYL